MQLEFFIPFVALGHRGQDREAKCLIPESGCGPFTDIELRGLSLAACKPKEVESCGLTQPGLMVLVGFVPQMQQTELTGLQLDRRLFSEVVSTSSKL